MYYTNDIQGRRSGPKGGGAEAGARDELGGGGGGGSVFDKEYPS